MPAASSPLARQVSAAALSDSPYALLARLRDEEPVAWVESFGMWFVTRRDDVLAVLRDPETFTVDSPASPIRGTFGAQMLSTDGDVHRRYKSACAPPFNAKAVTDGLGPGVAAEVERIVSALARRARDGAADLREVLAGPVAVFSVAHALGIPPDARGALRAWYDEFAAALASFDADSPARAQGRRRADEFRALVRSILARHAAAGDPTLLGVLARAVPASLTDDEIASNALIVLFGGIETTEAALLNAAWALLSHPAQLDDVRRDPALLDGAIEESLRWEPAVQTCHRYATRSATIGGVAIAAGDTVQCMLGSANRDPAHFTDPDRFDVRRANASDHLSFGAGRHFCLGAALARHEIRLALGAVLARLPGLRLDPDRPTWPRGHEFRKPLALWVRWGAGDAPTR